MENASTPSSSQDSVRERTISSPLLRPEISSSSISPQNRDDSAIYLRPYACMYPGCLMRFKRKYTLKDHVKCHTGEKPFVCPVRSCRKTFTTSGNLSRHKRLHPWLDAPLSCLVDGCGCTFVHEEKLERHMLTHFGDSGAHCCEAPNCGKVFTTAGNLRRHTKQSHTAADAGGGDSSPVSTPVGPRPDPLPAAASPWVAAGGFRLPQIQEGQQQLHHHQQHELHERTGVRQYPTDEEVLDALACLFDDDDDVGPGVPTRYWSM